MVGKHFFIQTGWSSLCIVGYLVPEALSCVFHRSSFEPRNISLSEGCAEEGSKTLRRTSTVNTRVQVTRASQNL